jgi:hypothetical protein
MLQFGWRNFAYILDCLEDIPKMSEVINGINGVTTTLGEVGKRQEV